MANKDMFMFWGSGSAPCWKPMIVLAEKGLWEGCPNKKVEFSKSEHKQSDILALNKRGQVPTFKDGNIVVNESGAICMYVEEKYSNDSNRLLPTDVKERAQVYQRMFEVSNLITSVTDPLVIYRYVTKKDDWDLDSLKVSTEKGRQELNRWNTIVGDNDFLCGNRFSMADVFFYPYMALLVRTGATLSVQPALKRYYDRVSGRPSIQATWPPHWKDCEAADYVSDL